MTDEPIDLEQMVSWARHEGYGKLHVVEKMAAEIERLRTERDALQARIDAAEQWVTDDEDLPRRDKRDLLRILRGQPPYPAALTGEAS